MSERRNWPPLLQAVADYRYPEARKLLDQGADVNAAVPVENWMLDGVTALMFATGAFDGYVLDERSPGRGFDPQFLEFLLHAGANINARTHKGVTALHLSLANAELRRFLLDHGADCEIANEYGAAPLHQAATYGGTDACRDLFQHGAKLETTDKYGYTPLLWAAQGAFPETIKALIELGANVEAALPDGNRALHLAANSVNWSRTADTLQVLLEAGAKVNMPGSNQNTPLHYAALGYSADAIRVLLSHGANRMARAANGATPLDTALLYHKDEAVRALQGG